jgi:Ca2+-binding RTX toxin-like protein
MFLNTPGDSDLLLKWLPQDRTSFGSDLSNDRILSSDFNISILIKDFSDEALTLAYSSQDDRVVGNGLAGFFMKILYEQFGSVSGRWLGPYTSVDPVRIVLLDNDLCGSEELEAALESWREDILKDQQVAWEQTKNFELQRLMIRALEGDVENLDPAFFDSVELAAMTAVGQVSRKLALGLDVVLPYGEAVHGFIADMTEQPTVPDDATTFDQIVSVGKFAVDAALENLSALPQTDEVIIKKLRLEAASTVMDLYEYSRVISDIVNANANVWYTLDAIHEIRAELKDLEFAITNDRRSVQELQEVAELFYSCDDADPIDTIGRAPTVIERLARPDMIELSNIAPSRNEDGDLIGTDGDDYLRETAGTPNVSLATVGLSAIFSDSSFAMATSGIYGGFGDDTIIGDDRGQELHGGDGDDLIEGGAGADTIVGGGGADTMTGGAGRDVFIVVRDGGSTTIEEFEIGTDVIDLVDTGFSNHDDALASLSVERGASALVFDDGTRIEVSSSAAGSAQISARDFMLDGSRTSALAPNPPFLPDPNTTVDDDSGLVPIYTIRAEVSSIEEGDGFVSDVVFTISRDIADRNVFIVLGLGGSIDENDTIGLTTMVDLSEGQFETTFVAHILGDELVESDETLIYSIEFISGPAVITDSTATVRIVNDDFDAQVTIDPTPNPDPAPTPGPDPEPVTVTIESRSPFNFAESGADRAVASGNAGGVRIIGDERDQEIIGNDSGNVLISGGGEDVMTGGGGADFFAFQRTDPLPDVTITDFDAQDKIALDDQFFGLGDAGVDLRQVTPDQILLALRTGFLGYDFETNELSVPGDGPGSALEVIVTFSSPPPIGLDDLFLF